jgi:Uma2 family endonuclease
MGQKPAHAYVVALLTAFLTAAFPERVRVQLAIAVADPTSEPEPDLVLLRSTIRDFADRHPGPADIALVIEVADTSIEFDRGVKSRLYARAGIQEYWIVDIPGRRTIVCRRPDGDEYGSVVMYDGTDHFGIEAFGCSTAQLLPETA